MIDKEKEEKPGEDGDERFAIRLCTICEEDGTLVPAIGYCKECEDFLCQSCKDAHSKTRVTKSHTVEDIAPPIIHHPRKDAAEGREVKPESEGYLVRIYRCGTVPGPEAEDGQTDQQESFAAAEPIGGAVPVDPAKAKARISRFGPVTTGPPQPLMGVPAGQMGMPGPGMHPGMMGGPGFGGPGMMGGPPGTMGGPGMGPGFPPGGAPTDDDANPAKKGLVNDPMAGLPPGGGPPRSSWPPGEPTGREVRSGMCKA